MFRKSKILVSGSARNAATLTFDGVDIMGHRLAEEVTFLLPVLFGHPPCCTMGRNYYFFLRVYTYSAFCSGERGY